MSPEPIVIYLDSSVLLAQLLGEERKPPPTLWVEELVSSRLAQYEVWARLHALRLGASHGPSAKRLLSALLYTELTSVVLERALHAFPVPLRTLDALHVASIDHLRSRGDDVSLATYDHRLSEAARAMGIPLEEDL